MADKDNDHFSDDRRLYSDGKTGDNEHDENLERLMWNETTHNANVDSRGFHEDNETNKNSLPRDSDLGMDASEDNDVDDNNKESFRSHEDANRSLSLLLQEIYSIAEQGGYDTSSENVICEVKALNALEATAGDIALSAQLYWDDFLASQENRQNESIHLHRGHREARGHHHQPPEDWLGQGQRPNDNNDLPIEAMAEESMKNRENWRVDLPPHFDGDTSNAAPETILRRRLEQSFNKYVDNSKLSGNRADEETEANKKSGKKRRRRHHHRDNPLDTNRMNRNRHHERSPKLRDSSSGMENANSSSSSSSSGMWSDDNEEADNAEHNFLGGDNNNYQDRRLRHLEDHNRRQDIGNNPLLPRDAVVAAFDNLNGDGDAVDIRRAVAAAAESVSVSDDEAAMAGLRRIFVEAKNFKTRKPRILRKPIQSDGDDNEDDRVSASFLDKEQRYGKSRNEKESTVDVDSDEFDEGYQVSSIKQASIRSNGIVVGDEDEDGYLSDNDWIWDSQTSRDVLAPFPPIDVLWGGIKRPSFHNDKLLPREPHGAQEGAEYAPDNRNQEKSASTSGSSKRKTKSRKYNEALVKSQFGWVVGERTDVDNSRSEQPNVDLLSKHIKKESKIRVDSEKSSHIDDDIFIRIPYTWLNSGFQFSENRTSTSYGLALRPPNKDDIGYDEWKASSLWRGNARNAVPPPYHCRSLTALISIVNGLLYTGVCIPATGKLSSENVSSTSSDGSIRQPLIEISEELDELEKMQRVKHHLRQKVKNRSRIDKSKDEENDKLLLEQKMPTNRELDSRLADALSSLLSIAIRASNERKMKALKAFYSKTGKKDFINQQQKLKLERKLQKFPACWFEAENIKRYREHSQSALRNNNVEGPGSRNNDIENQVQICVSYTNIEDVRSYVLGNLEAFKSSGGCALFLETVLRIHGKGAVTRMIQKSRQKRAKNHDSGCIDVKKETLEQDPSLKSDSCPHLIYCTCEQRHKTNLEQNPLFNRQRSSSGNAQDCDTTPETHDCISIEMISLLLTGYVQTTLEGWSCQLLQLGLLSDVPGQVGKGLTRPEKPVWIVRGPTCYSSLWLNGCNDRATSFSRFDNQIGSVAVLTHWNCWYNVGNQTKLRLVSNRSKPNDWCFPPVSTNGHDLFNNVDNGISLKENSVQRQINGNRNAESNVLDLLIESRYANDQRSREIAETEEIDSRLVVSKEEIDSVTVHRDDPKFYPGNYRLWRFKILNTNSTNPDLILMQADENGDYHNKASGTDVGIHEARVENVEHPPHVTNSSLANHHNDDRWKPYHRLSEREQLIVEMKFGQKLNCILWTRWPRATIDRYEPEGPASSI